jgi:hypothetical protein
MIDWKLLTFGLNSKRKLLLEKRRGRLKRRESLLWGEEH